MAPGTLQALQPIWRWREDWSPAHERLLDRQRDQRSNRRGVRGFARILKLHQAQFADFVAQVGDQALADSSSQGDGVELCFRQLEEPDKSIVPMELTR